MVFTALISLGQGNCEGEFPSGAQDSPNQTTGGGAGATSQTITIQPNSTGLGAAAFGTNPLIVPSGSVVTWINNDTVAHSIVSTAGLFDSGALNPGQSFSQTFTVPGTYDYFCGIHGTTSESGRIIVTAAGDTTTPTPGTGVPVPSPTNTPQFPIPAPTPTTTSPTGF